MGTRVAIGIDLGATSLRMATGVWTEGEFKVEVLRQEPNRQVMNGELVCWDIARIENFVREAVSHGQSLARDYGDDVTIGIDTWGVDIAIIAHDGTLLAPPVAYRDVSHTRASEMLISRHADYFRQTGVCPQPFNTVFQLQARRLENSDWPNSASWLMIPEYLTHCLSPNSGRHELTNASTTQLLAIDGNWAAEIFDEIGWPVPGSPPTFPGGVVSDLGGVRLVRVATHDTASAVYGLGVLNPGEAYLNLGTWGLLGTTLSAPVVSDAAFESGFTNERAADGAFRFLKNIPGFHIINRLHAELKLPCSVADWLRGASSETRATFNCHDPSLYAPASMIETCLKFLPNLPANAHEWAAVALDSLAATIVAEVRALACLTAQPIAQICIAGGGANCDTLIDRIRERDIAVRRGPAEATLLGNMMMQFRSTGDLP